jgi:hypothetical protein
MTNILTVAPGVFVDPMVRRDIEVGEEYLMLDTVGLKRLGLTKAQTKLLLRLDHCGLIVLHQITPRRRLLRMSSWREHIQRVSADPEFWERADIRRKWRIACLAI